MTEHTLVRDGARWSCSEGDWEPPLGTTVHREFDKHLLSLRPTFYHGTRSPFGRGGYLFPSNRTGHELRTGLVLPPGWVDDRADWVYFTPDLELAWAYAEDAPGRGKPRVLVVQPVGEVQVDDSTVNGEYVEAYRSEWAKVLRVIREEQVT